MKDLINLQNAHVTQHSGEKGKGSWRVQANITNELLHELPGNLLESDVFSVMAFARMYELMALNSGMQFQKKHSDFKHKEEKQNLLKVIEELQVANNKLAKKVHKFLED